MTPKPILFADDNRHAHGQFGIGDGVDYVLDLENQTNNSNPLRLAVLMAGRHDPVAGSHHHSGNDCMFEAVAVDLVDGKRFAYRRFPSHSNYPRAANHLGSNSNSYSYLHASEFGNECNQMRSTVQFPYFYWTRSARTRLAQQSNGELCAPQLALESSYINGCSSWNAPRAGQSIHNFSRAETNHGLATIRRFASRPRRAAQQSRQLEGRSA